MKLGNVLLSSLLIVLVVLSVHGQSLALKANIPFEFTVGGKSLPPGQYEFTTEKNGDAIRVKGVGKNAHVLAPVLTRLSGALHTSKQDSHVVFDKVGETHILSEIWPRSGDGYAMSATKG
ncbi:MAG: hypothetical protein ABFD89_22980, partial [Bryobacteraceae bacterium]